MRFRTTVVLLALVIAAALWLGFETGRRVSDDEYDLLQRRVFPPTEYQVGGDLMRKQLAERAVRVELRREDERIVLERAAPDAKAPWRISVPVRTYADAGEVTALLSVLEALEAGRTVTPGSDALESWGLEKPRGRVSFATPEKSWTLEIGGLSADGLTLYVRREDRPESIYAVGKSLLEAIGKGVADLRDKAALRIAGGSALKGFELRARDEVMVACRLERSGWRLTSPFADEANISEVVRFFEALLKTRVAREDFVSDSPGDPKQYGLDKPAYTVTVYEGESSRSLLIGARAREVAHRFYARRGDERTVFLLPETSVHALIRPADTLRERRALPFEVETVVGIEMALRREKVQLALQGKAWTFVSPSGLRADNEEVKGFLERLRGVEVQEWIDDFAPGLLAEAGLTEPAARISVTLKGGARHTLDIGGGQAKAVSAKSGLRYARRDGKGPVLLLAPAFVERLLAGRLLFMSRVMLEFQPEDVTGIRIERPGGKVVLWNKDGSWRLQAPVRTHAHEGAVREMLRKLSYLEAQELAATGSGGVARFGLERPRIRVEARVKPLGATSEKEHVLLVGGAANEGSVYAMVTGRNAVFLMSRGVVDLLTAEFVSDVVSSFNPVHARMVEIVRAQPHAPVRFELGAGQWRMTSPRQAGRQERVVGRILDEWKDLRAASVAVHDKAGADLAALGLSPPAFTIRIDLGDGEIRRIRVGRSDGQRRHLVTDDAPSVFLVEKSALAATFSALGR